MPKVTEEYLDTRRQTIIDAAYRCFARKGFHQATMRDIYSEAGLSAGAVYRTLKAKKRSSKQASFLITSAACRSLRTRSRNLTLPLRSIA